jgi:putative ABC transport system substrate-binding protein
MMKRRDFIMLVGGAVAWPLAARAQQAGLPVVGFLHSGSANVYAPFVGAFHRGLKESGYFEGQNVVIEYRWAENQIDRLPTLAADLVRDQVAVIVGNTEGTLAAKAITAAIPIVFTTGGDPIRQGFVASLNRPGGNVTGVKWFSTEVSAKNLQLLHELVPQANTIGFLVDPKFPTAADQLNEIEGAARSLGVRLRVLSAGTENEIDAEIAAFAQQGGIAFVVGDGTFFTVKRDQIIALAARYAMATISTSDRSYAASGGLINYTSSSIDSYRRAGVYAGRILKGEKAADLPVETSTMFELVINLKTAKALSLTMPPSLLAIADEVIE